MIMMKEGAEPVEVAGGRGGRRAGSSTRTWLSGAVSPSGGAGVLRLPVAQPHVGVGHVRRVHLLQLLRHTPGAGRAHHVRTVRQPVHTSC